MWDFSQKGEKSRSSWVLFDRDIYSIVDLVAKMLVLASKIAYLKSYGGSKLWLLWLFEGLVPLESKYFEWIAKPRCIYIINQRLILYKIVYKRELGIPKNTLIQNNKKYH